MQCFVQIILRRVRPPKASDDISVRGQNKRNPVITLSEKSWTKPQSLEKRKLNKKARQNNMSNALDQLKATGTVVVSDSGDFEGECWSE